MQKAADAFPFNQMYKLVLLIATATAGCIFILIACYARVSNDTSIVFSARASEATLALVRRGLECLELTDVKGQRNAAGDSKDRQVDYNLHYYISLITNSKS